ncbi:MAG: hypothetical protein QOH57_3099 [Mycobacterium sp.]|nr:hypothetical protein [Mycobacterium sp.]
MTQWQPPDPAQQYGGQPPPVPPYPQAPQGYPPAPAYYPSAPSQYPYPQTYPQAYPQTPVPGYGAGPQIYPGYPAGAAPVYSPYGQSPSPSGGTAITAAVLSFLGTVAHALGAIMLLVAMSAVNDVPKARDLLPGWYGAFAIGSCVLNIALSVTLLVGGIQLLRHVGWSRMLLAGACAVAVVWRIVDVIATKSIYDSLEKFGVDASARVGGAAGTTLGLIFPIVTLVLVLLPLTKRWCEVPTR